MDSSTVERLPSHEVCQKAVDAMMSRSLEGLKEGLALLDIPSTSLIFRAGKELKVCGHDVRDAVNTMIHDWVGDNKDDFMTSLIRIRKIVASPPPKVSMFSLRSRAMPLWSCAGLAALLMAFFLRSFGSHTDSIALKLRTSATDGFTEAFMLAVTEFAKLSIVGYIMVVVFLAVQQRSIMYVPEPSGEKRSPFENPAKYRNPSEWGMSYKAVTISSVDSTHLHSWLITQEDSKPPKVTNVDDSSPPLFTILYFHGNAGNIGHRLQHFHDMHKKLGVNILALEYRGFGDSDDGNGPGETAWLMDALAAYRWLVKHAGTSEALSVDANHIILYGCSVGGCVAIGLSEHLVRTKTTPLPAGIVLENTPTSMADMAVAIFPPLLVLKSCIRWPLLRDEWKTAEKLGVVARESPSSLAFCLLSGSQDEIVPPAHMVDLYKIIQDGCKSDSKCEAERVLEFWAFPQGRHNDTPIRGGELYWTRFSEFLNRVCNGIPLVVD